MAFVSCFNTIRVFRNQKHAYYLIYPVVSSWVLHFLNTDRECLTSCGRKPTKNKLCV